MPRTYTEKQIVSGTIANASDLNRELGTFTDILNGRLDGHSLPLAAIGSTDLAAHTETTISITTSVQGAVSGFHRTETRTTPITYDATDGTIKMNWNDIEADFLLEFEAKAGMVIGSAIVCGQKWATDAVGIEVGADAVWEIRILGNGRVIAQSGYIPVGTYTIDLPYCFPCGSEYITIKVQWRVLNTIEPSLGWTHPELTIKDRMAWARNQYR
tara:strand:- start:1490 stop:2131 length:642 start_codon:yes stop_codon:yes gene_type:complete